MDLSDVIDICRAWDRLGWAVQSQLDAVLDGRDIEDQNPNAMDMVDEFLAVVAEKAEWVGDGAMGGQARDLSERIATSRVGEVAAG